MIIMEEDLITGRILIAMSATKPSLFARLLSKLNPRLTFGLIACSLYLLLVAFSNIFAAYDAIVTSEIQSLSLRVFAILLYTVPAIGILMMKRWARLLGIFVSAIACLLGILTFLTGNNADGAFIIITHGAVLFCLMSRKTRAAFATQAP